jgi:hypothetical protein
MLLCTKREGPHSDPSGFSTNGLLLDTPFLWCDDAECTIDCEPEIVDQGRDGQLLFTIRGIA